MTIATAFAELRRKHKLIARQNFMCCQGCGLSKISEEIDEKPAAKRPLGAVFFHKQDAKRWDEDGRTWLTFSGVEDGPVTTGEIGEIVVAVLAAHGCPVEWNGSPDERLLVWRDENTRRERAAKLLGRVHA